MPESVASTVPLTAAESETAPRGLLAAFDRWLTHYGIGRLHLTLPSGRAARIGTSSGLNEGEIRIARYRALWKIWRRGALGFAEAYMDGDLDTSDLRGLFDLYYANEAALVSALPGFNATRRSDVRYHAARANTRQGSRRNIADHYDLGNAFYRLWLDESLFYSSGIYREADSTLEAAQREKLACILGALDLSAGASLLEIGCGWGAMAEAAAGRDVRVTAITISAEQLDATESRLAAAGLAPRVDLRFEDYRDTAGTFDRLVSIEMIEAVGEENWPLFFSTVADRLSPDGIAVIQAITIREDAFEGYRRNPDFIQRYIFPGGMLPTVEQMAQRATEAGLAFETVECFGQSYARTLVDWRRRFEAAWPEIEKLGFDERFRRMWLYYLAYCEVGFRRGLIDVGLYRLRKPA